MRKGLLVMTMLAVALGAQAQTTDKAVERFIIAYLPYLPGSTVELTAPRENSTATGSYLVANAVRSSIASKEKDQLGILVDRNTHMIAVGLVFQTPAEVPADALGNLPMFVEGIMPQILNQMMSTRVRVRFPASPSKPNAVMPFIVEVSTGFGWVKMPAAVAADARHFLLGGMWSLDRDPRATRREILAQAPVQWDPGHEKAPISLIEFSDFQCPACKRGWGMSKEVLTAYGDKIHHGLVNFPLTNSHPWAFRAAVAGHCVGLLAPGLVTELKEELYAGQESLTLETLDGAVIDFLKAQKLDEAKFRACYLKDPAVEAVLKQIEVGQQLGVMATPTNYANGEILPFGNKEVWQKRLAAILAAGGLPENAAEIRLDPTPVPTATKPAATPKK